MADEIGIYFGWLEARPDNRQYRQNSVLLAPQTQSESPVKVWVGVPLEKEYVHNYDQVISAQLDTNLTMPEIILTPKGMQLALERLGEALVEAEPAKDDDDDWVGIVAPDDKPSKGKAKAEKDDDTGNWTSGDDDDEEKSDDPDSEKWDDEQEDWNS